MIEIIENLGYWNWLFIGLILGGLELLAPGSVLMWFGIAALCVGLIDALFTLSWQAEVVTFIVLSVGFLFAGRRFFRSRRDVKSGQYLNQRGHTFVGRTFVLEGPIKNGTGRVRIGDIFWRVRGDDMRSGAHVKVIAVDGAELLVEAAE